jgi:hypothetical protein
MSYASQVLADGAVSYWSLNETSGTTAADAKGVRPGTISGGVTLGVPGVTAGTTAMAFDGTGRIDAAALPGLQPAFSQELWMWASVKPPTNAVALSRDQFVNVTTQFYVLSDPGGLRLVFRLVTAPVASISGDPDTTLQVWHHVVVTHDGSTLRLYRDNVLLGSVASTLEPDGGPATAIGGDLRDSAAGWRGRLSDVAVYPAALTPAQIANHYALRTAVGGARPAFPWEAVLVMPF